MSSVNDNLLDDKLIESEMQSVEKELESKDIVNDVSNDSADKIDDIEENDINEDDDEIEDIVPLDSKGDFFTKAQNFVINKKEYFIAGGIVTGLYILFLLFTGVFSGTKTVLVGDSYSQIGVFFSHIFKVFRGEATLFYSNYYAKGFEIFSTLQYMYLNPFYLIVLIGGESLIYEMFAIAMYLMLLFTTLVFIWFTEKYIKNISMGMRILFALMYVFSPFLNYNYSFISWYIYPALILLLADRFLEFIKTKKIASFIAVFVWYVISCFSIGISTAIVIFIVCMAYVLIVVNKEDRVACVNGLFVVFVSTALISITILLPSIIGVLNSQRTGSFLKNILTKGNSNFSKITVIVSDYCILAMAIYYFIVCDKKNNMNKFLMVGFAIAYLPMILDTIMRILCFSQYNGFYARFYFLNEVTIFIPAMLIFEKKTIKCEDCATDGFSNILVKFLMVGISIVILFLEIFNFRKIGISIKNPRQVDRAIFTIALSFAILSIIMVITCYLFNKRKVLSKKLVKISIIFVMIISLGFNCLTFLGGASSEENDRNYINVLLQDKNLDGNIKLHSADGGSEILDKVSSVRQTGIFSSLIPSNIVDSYKKLGYLTSSVAYIDSCGSLMSDSLNGIKYYLSKTKLDRPYLTNIELQENCGYYLYENQLASNGVFTLDSDFQFNENNSAMDNINQLKDYYGISGEFFEEVEVSLKWYDDDNNLVDVEKIENFNYSMFKKQKVTFKAEKSGILYMNSYLSEEEGEDGLNKYFLSMTDNSIYEDLVYLDEGQEYSFYLLNYYNTTKFENVKYRFLDYNIAKQFCEKVKNSGASYKYLKNGYKVNIVANKDCNLYIMTPDIDGLHYQLNGGSVEVSNVLSGMTCVSISAGNNELVASYKYPYTLHWLLFAVISIVIVAILIAMYYFNKLTFVKKPIYYGMIAVFVAIVSVVYVAGSIISVCLIF